MSYSSSSSSSGSHSARSQPSFAEIPVPSQTCVEGPNGIQNCSFDRFLLSFHQRAGKYEDELQATKNFARLLTVAKAFVDAGGVEEASSRSSVDMRRSKAFCEQMNRYFTAPSSAERSQPLAEAFNTTLYSFRDAEFDDLPASNDILFSTHALGIAGTHSYDLKSPTNDQVPEANILNLWEIGFSHQISPAILPIVDRPEPSRSRSRPRSRPAVSRFPWLAPRPPTPTSPSSQSTACSSRKRRLENASTSPPKKRKLSVLPPRFTAQSASYAEKRLAAEPLMNHAIGLVLEDEQLSLWWHDRESTIQSFAIDLTSELPRLVVLIILFQRFSETDWGSSGLYSESPDGTTSIKVAERSFSATFRPSDLRTRHGKGTLAVPVSESGCDSKFFMKASFNDPGIPSEAETIAKCHSLAEADSNVLDHLPSVVVSQNFPDSSTCKMRNLLGLPSHKPKLLQILVFDWLEAITSLKGERFWVAFWEIIRCHFLLWQKGLQHGDISVNNLMFNPLTEKGILNDYDLALFVLDQPSPSPRRTPTGTMPFMALELLTKKGWNGDVRRLYRHDLESFAWVLLWICAHFRDGKEDRPGKLDLFLTNDPISCYDRKSARLPSIVPSSDYASYWPAAMLMVMHWRSYEFHNGQQIGMAAFIRKEDLREEVDDASHLKQILGEVTERAKCSIPFDIL
ncbi:hypothetical protein C8J56DRAFT_479527 [Mycena floridula]|nr:hypothetical protein C8J56DRAFT_479527 [Mycena floridula]